LCERAAASENASTEESDIGEAAGMVRLAHAVAQPSARDRVRADEKSAEAAAVTEFKIGDEQRRRLIVREQE
jgi:hypothetical protein